jgi:hypothetical protein
MKKKIIWGSIIVLLIGGSIAAWYAYGEFNRKPETAADKETDMKVEATAIMNEFMKDQKSAETKYAKKTIEISGKVSAVEINGKDDISVSLYTDATDDLGIPMSVKVMLTPDQESGAKKLKEGDKITLKGLYTGMNTDIEFNRGIIIE